MSQVSTTRKLKRQASGDIEDRPAKQTRTIIENTYARLYSPLRRSDSQVLDINSSCASVEHLPRACGSIHVPPELRHRSEVEDKAESTDEESQDESAAWDGRTKAHRHSVLFKRPQDSHKIKRVRSPPLVPTISAFELLEGDSEEEHPSELVDCYGEAAAGKARQLMALRAARAAAPKLPQTLVTPAVVIISAPSDKTTSHQAGRAATKSIATTSANSSYNLQEARPTASSEQPPRRDSGARQRAIDAITGHRSSIVSFPVVTPTPASVTTSSLPLVRSQILRRSRRVATMQQKRL